MNDETLRIRVARLLLEGELPREVSERVLAGHGDGSTCDICGDAIGRDDVEYDVECPARQNKILRLHLHCHDVWTKTLR